ncbi:MAG: hypothetical protein JXA82_02560 [Sedimentisphaerales bacterium]|nr:hypothetical protein [Sedimentisphaerales bacterium]
MKKGAFSVALLLAILSLLIPCSGCGILGGALLGGVIGYQSGEACAGALIGAAVCGAGEIAHAVGELGKGDKPKECIVTVRVYNENGSFIPVRLKKKGCEYIGPRGEHYDSVPSQEQLRPYYGMKG